MWISLSSVLLPKIDESMSSVFQTQFLEDPVDLFSPKARLGDCCLTLSPLACSRVVFEEVSQSCTHSLSVCAFQAKATQSNSSTSWMQTTRHFRTAFFSRTAHRLLTDLHTTHTYSLATLCAFRNLKPFLNTSIVVNHYSNRAVSSNDKQNTMASSTTNAERLGFIAQEMNKRGLDALIVPTAGKSLCMRKCFKKQTRLWH